jgi:hypothetical protein
MALSVSRLRVESQLVLYLPGGVRLDVGILTFFLILRDAFDVVVAPVGFVCDRT